MKRKLICILLALCLAALTLAGCGAKSTTAADNVIASGNCGAAGHEADVQWALTDDGTLTVTGTGAMADYEWLDGEAVSTAPWWEQRESVRTIVIGDGVTAVGAEAFDSCVNCTGLTLPDTLTAIGDDAFRHCDGLTAVTIPASVTTLGDGAFKGCTGLKEMTFPGASPAIADVNGDGTVDLLDYQALYQQTL